MVASNLVFLGIISMKSLALAAALLASTCVAFATPSQARLQLSIGVGPSTFTCFDGQVTCDVSGGANNLLVIDQTVGSAFVQISLAQSTFGAVNTLQLSSSSIINQGLAPITVKLLASDTGFDPPVSFVNSSASLTFNAAVGSTQSFTDRVVSAIRS
jgi:hypothetical protein